MEYFRAIWSELLKIRRSWAFTLAMVTPMGTALFIFLVMLEVPARPKSDVWIFFLRGVVWSWAAMVTPMFAALLLALLASIDHNSGGWKLMLSQPVSRPPIYVAKLAVALLLMAGSELVLGVSCLGLGFLLPLLRPDLGDYYPGVDVSRLFALLAIIYLAGFLMVAIHTWLSIRTSNFVLSLGVVILAETANVLGMRQDLAQRYWPWLFPFDAVRLLGLQPRDAVLHFWSVSQLMLLSLLGGAVVTALAIWDFSRSEMI